MKKFLFSVLAFGVATSVLAKSQVITVKLLDVELYSESSFLFTTDKGQLLFDHSLGMNKINQLSSLAEKKQCVKLIVKETFKDNSDIYITKADIKKVKCTK